MLLKSINLLSGVLIVFIFISCSVSVPEKDNGLTIINYSEINKGNWLIGTWQNVSENEISTEIWEKKNDSIYSGISFVVVNKDTVSYETMILEQVGSNLFYIPTVKDQNEGQAIKFLLSSSSENQLIFENLKHDFPQKISYNLITKDSILAIISGPVDGKQKSQEFPFVRKK